MLWVTNGTPKTSGGKLIVQPVCEHPGHFHALRTAGVETTSTHDLDAHLALVASAVAVCAGRDVHIPTSFNDAVDVPEFQPPHKSPLVSVWCPDLSKPLWVCEQHAILYSTRRSHTQVQQTVTKRCARQQIACAH